MSLWSWVRAPHEHAPLVYRQHVTLLQGDEPGSSPGRVQKPRQALNSHITVQVPEWSKGYDSRSYDESLAGSNPVLDISRLDFESNDRAVRVRYVLGFRALCVDPISQLFFYTDIKMPSVIPLTEQDARMAFMHGMTNLQGWGTNRLRRGQIDKDGHRVKNIHLISLDFIGSLNARPITSNSIWNRRLRTTKAYTKLRKRKHGYKLTLLGKIQK